MNRVVVLMSAYNGEKFIRPQLDSILGQKECELTLLVRDDGSIDGTKEILNEYQERNLLTWYSGENLKPPSSFMDLVFHAPDADYYAFADQDDIWDEDKIICAVKQLEKEEGPAFYHSNARLADADGKPTGILLYRKNPHLNFYSLACNGGILGCTMVFNHALRRAVVEAGMPKKICMHDFYMGVVGMAIGGKSIYDHIPHINYRQHGGNVLGVAIDLKTKIKSKIKQFLNEGTCSITEQSREILAFHQDKMVPEYRQVCTDVTLYKQSVFRTIGVALNPKARYSSFKNSIFIRVCLLFRRR